MKKATKNARTSKIGSSQGKVGSAPAEKAWWAALCDCFDVIFEIADEEDISFAQIAKDSGLHVNTIRAMYNRTRRRYQFRSVALLAYAVNKNIGVD